MISQKKNSPVLFMKPGFFTETKKSTLSAKKITFVKENVQHITYKQNSLLFIKTINQYIVFTCDFPVQLLHRCHLHDDELLVE